MITKITVEVEGKEVEMSLEEAQKIYEDLRGLFEKPAYIPPYIPPYPIPRETPWPNWSDGVYKGTNMKVTARILMDDN